MSTIETLYDEAQIHANEEAINAKRHVDEMDIELLKKEYVELIGLVAYYTKLEATMSAMPRLHYDAIKQAMKELGAEKLVQQAEIAAEQGVEISGLARVPAKPLLNLLIRVNSILG
jgi:hypothetical protein